MTSKLNLWLFLLLGFNHSLWAKGVDGEAMVRQYDDGRTQVLSPHMELQSLTMDDRLTIRAGVAQDFVTSSSSDVVTNSSQGKMSDTRNEVSMGMNYDVAEGTVGWSYIRSEENDWLSNGYTISATRDFFQKNTVVGMSFTYGTDNVRSSANANLDEYFFSQTYNVSLTQVLGRLSVMQLSYDFRLENGYLESPYRKARQKKADGTFSTVGEVHPEIRARNALTIKYNRYLQSWLWALNNSLRLYTDSWSLMAYTYKFIATKEWSPKINFSFSLRYHSQQAVNFYQDYYGQELPPFRTGNKTLSTITSYQIGMMPDYKWTDTTRFFAKVEYFSQNFANHTDIGNKDDPTDDEPLKLTATVVGLGVSHHF